MPRDLIAAVSPRPSTLLPRAARLDLKASKAPVSATPVSWGSGASSRGHQLASLPSGLREEAVADQNGNHMPTQPPSLPRQAFSLQPAELVPAASVPATAAQTRPVTTALSLQDRKPAASAHPVSGSGLGNARTRAGAGQGQEGGLLQGAVQAAHQSLWSAPGAAPPLRGLWTEGKVRARLAPGRPSASGNCLQSWRNPYLSGTLSPAQPSMGWQPDLRFCQRLRWRNW